MASFESILEQNRNQDLVVLVDVMDWTSGKPSSITLNYSKFSLEVTFPTDQKGISELAGLLLFYFSNPNVILISWNLKNFISYIYAKTGRKPKLESKVFDLKTLEHYLGIWEEKPKTFLEAKQRLLKVVKHPSWIYLKDIYKDIYLPLILDVIPEIEVIGVTNQKTRQLLHSYYDISGQLNGRMKCSKELVRGFNPHTLGEEDKSVLKPPAFDHAFMYLDFKHMEVSMLQWLSGDPVLGSILESGEDLYFAIWKILTTLDCNETYREKCKSLFLPVVYGQGINSVAERANIPIDTAKKLVQRIYTKFPVAIDWIKKQQINLVDNWAKDKFGRMRRFDIGEEYKIRNFVVQSPAALFCLLKLIRLKDKLGPNAKLGFHIHDGYVLFSPVYEVWRNKELAIEALESEELMFPGLKCKVTCKIGKTLASLK